MQYRYIGPHKEVDLVLGNRLYRVKRGGTLEVEASLAANLGDSPHWEPVKAPAKVADKPSSKTTDE